MLRPLIVFALLVSIAFADTETNNNCSEVELISELHNISIAKTHEETGTVYQESDTYDYYYFQSQLPAEISVSIYGNKTNYSFFIGTQCDGGSIYTNTSDSNTKNAGTFEVGAGDFIYLKIQRRYNTLMSYNLTINYTPIVPKLSVSNASINEGNHGWYTKKIPVTLSAAHNQTVTVHYETFDDTATLAGNDYKAATGVLTFLPGETTRMIPLEINGDTIQEPDESFKVILSNPSSNASISDGIATITLLNDDGHVVQNNLRDFLIRNPVTTRNIRGNLAMIGNSVLCPKNNTGACISDSNTANNGLDLKFINTDNFNGTYKNSSRAQLAIPNNATIKWAGLYTQGYIQGITNTATITKTLTNTPTRLTIPSLGNINLTPSISNIFANGGSGYSYGSFSEISQLVGKKGVEVNGWITAANIIAHEGTDSSGLGNYGAWSLVVVYEDDSLSLKNISVFDGYRAVYNATGYTTVDIAIDGFLTPTSGEISSSLAIFAGEGDKNIEGDRLYLDGDEISIVNQNAFNSSITGVVRSPNLINNQGIDIQNHDVSSIIKNGQQSATIRLTSTQDKYFPSVVAFATELYEPRVCYAQTLLDENGNEISTLSLGDTITIATWISNMKKDAEDSNLETADKVEITLELDSENLEYIPESITIQNINESSYFSKTDTKDADTAEFFFDTNTSKWRVGIGASGTDGGRLLPNEDNNPGQKTYATFQAKITQSGDISINNLYKVSYENSLLGVRFGDESPLNIGICTDFDTTLNVSAPLGAFNVVHAGFNQGSNSTDGAAEENALYTQIAGQAFDVTVLALGSDFSSIQPYTGTVQVSIIENPGYVAGAGGTNQALCDNALPLSTKSISFDNETQKNLSFSYPNAHIGLGFKVSFGEGASLQHVCSRDPGGFAVRPASYVYQTESDLIGANTYTLQITSQNIDESTSTTNYNQTSSNIDASMHLVTPAGCGLAPWNESMSLSGGFSLGVMNYNFFTYSNVGDVRVEFKDTKWTSVDQGSSNGKGYDDCIVDSHSNTPTGGKIGCNIYKEEVFSFVAKSFQNTASFINGEPFYYTSGGNGVSPTLNINTQAILGDNTIATNYTQSCFAKNITTNLTLNNAPQERKDTIAYLPDNNTLIANNENVAISTLEDEFNAGMADVRVLFNFTRQTNTAHEPFHVFLDDFNITSTTDTNGLSGTDFDRTINMDNNATFYYGRVHAPDYRFGGKSGTARVYYEVYCKDCNTTEFNALGNQSPDTLYWHQNTLHDATLYGSVGSFISLGDVRFGSANYGAATTTTATAAIASGVEVQILTTNQAPYTDRIRLTPSSWLIYNPFNPAATTTDFTVEFYGAGAWAGEGSVHKTEEGEIGTHAHTTDQNTTIKRNNRRINW